MPANADRVTDSEKDGINVVLKMEGNFLQYFRWNSWFAFYPCFVPGSDFALLALIGDINDGFTTIENYRVAVGHGAGCLLRFGSPVMACRRIL